MGFTKTLYVVLQTFSSVHFDLITPIQKVFMQVLGPINGGGDKPRALIGFEPRTEPESSTRNSHSTSTPPGKCSGDVV